MFPPKTTSQLITLGFIFSCASFSQQKPTAALNPHAQELPVYMKQSVSAGKTAVGTKVRAELAVATLVEGKVVPRNATLTGEVIESAAKTATTPSRLAIRLDSAQWKHETATLKAYLTAWYYPDPEVAGQNLQYGPEQPTRKTWNGQGAYPDPKQSPDNQPSPVGDSDHDKSPVPSTPATKTFARRFLMKDVECVPTADGGATLVSQHANIKLDNLTTYVFAAIDPPRAK